MIFETLSKADLNLKIRQLRRTLPEEVLPSKNT
jgi:hypothetical protein